MLNKSHILAIIRISILLLGFKGFGQSTFNKFLPFGQWSVATDVFVNLDSTYTVLGQYNNSAEPMPGLLLTRFDKQGNVLLQKKYLGNTSEGYIFYFKNKLYIPVNSSSILVLGAFTSSGNKTGIILAKINTATLDTSWVRYYSDPVYDLPVSHIIQLNANRFWLIGNKFNDDDLSYSARPVIFQADTLGNINFRQELDNLTSYNPDVVTYDPLQARIYMAGVNYNIPIVTPGYLACLDTTGAVAWKKESNTCSYIAGFVQIEKRNDYIILSGSKWIREMGGWSGLKLSLTKINCSDGSLIWQKTYNDEEWFNALYSFTINPDESITAAGSKLMNRGNGITNWDGVLMKANSMGEGLWMKSFGTYTNNSQEMLTDIKSSPDHGYIMCGRPNTADGHFWVIKTDSLGNAPGAVTQTISTQDVPDYTAVQEIQNEHADLIVYPNPVSETLSISLQNVNITRYEIKLVNLLGKEVQAETRNKEPGKELDLYDLDSGLYFLQVLNDGKLIATKKIIKK